MDRFRARRARGRPIVVGMDGLVPVTNVFRELSQGSGGVSERDDPFCIFRIVLKYLIEILPFVLSDTENTAMIDPKVCGELLKSVCGGWKVQHPPTIRFVERSHLCKKQALVLATPQHCELLEPKDTNDWNDTCLCNKNTSYTLLTRDGGTT